MTPYGAPKSRRLINGQQTPTRHQLRRGKCVSKKGWKIETRLRYCVCRVSVVAMSTSLYQTHQQPSPLLYSFTFSSCCIRCYTTKGDHMSPPSFSFYFSLSKCCCFTCLFPSARALDPIISLKNQVPSGFRTPWLYRSGRVGPGISYVSSRALYWLMMMIVHIGELVYRKSRFRLGKQNKT